MLPISPSAESAISGSPSTPSSEHSVFALSGSNRSRTVASRSPKTPMMTALTVSSGLPTASTASASSSASAVGTRRSTDWPSMLASAVAALPEPMFDISRRASSWRSVRFIGVVTLLGRSGQFGWEAGRAATGVGKGIAVDDEGDLAVREDGAARQGARVADLGRQRAGDQLALADEPLEDEGEAAVRSARDDDIARVRRRWVAERLGKVDEGEHAVVQHERPPSDHRPHRLLRKVDRALDPLERDRERRVMRLDEERGDDRKRERQADLYGRSDAQLRGHDDRAPEAADRISHGVHADAAARDVARRLGGREAGREQELDRAHHVDRLNRIGGNQAPLCGAPRDQLGVDAPAVVAHGDDDVRAGVPSGELERARGLLAGRHALLGRLEGVVERVPDEMYQRVAERVDDGAVKFGIAPVHHELDLLAELRREIADQAWEAHEDGVDLDHAHLHDHRLERLRAPRQLADGLGQALDTAS